MFKFCKERDVFICVLVLPTHFFSDTITLFKQESVSVCTRNIIVDYISKGNHHTYTFRNRNTLFSVFILFTTKIFLCS